MRRLIAAAIAAFFLFASCSTITNVPLRSESGPTAVQLEAGKTYRVTTTDGFQYHTRDLVVRADSVLFSEDMTRYKIARNNVKTIAKIEKDTGKTMPVVGVVVGFFALLGIVIASEFR